MAGRVPAGPSPNCKTVDFAGQRAASAHGGVAASAAVAEAGRLAPTTRLRAPRRTMPWRPDHRRVVTREPDSMADNCA
jgi:hypothetical protein